MSKAYPLQSLLSIRNRRLDEALKNKTACQQKVTQAESEIVTMREKLSEYKKWLEEEELRRYKSFFEGKYKLPQIEEFNSGIKSIRMKEFEMDEEIKQAEIKLEKLREELRNEIAKCSEARKKLQKLETHKEIWLELEKLEDERQSESESEDFKTKSVTEF